MTGAFGAAMLSAICYGVGTALQARGARRAPDAEHAGVRSLAGVVRQWPFVAGTLLDLCGFAAQLVALRYLPLFVVQAAQAGSLAVTALACVPILGIRLGARHWAAVLAVTAGLALLGASSGGEGVDGAGITIRIVLLAAAFALGAGAFVAARLRPPGGPIIQGVVAGLGFGLTALCVRAIPDVAPAAMVRDPAAYAAAVAGACAFLSFAAALQRGAVTTVSALVIVGETALPAVAGITLWHDHTRPGWTMAALLGFALAVTGSLILARFAEPDPAPDRAAPGSTETGRSHAGSEAQSSRRG
ncbi:hypothetical protein [Krasilnikovia sp. MM14-A1259]|uniref:hypothetical protein n=1 Tax=Krasilnikovia sp. MM14-A1259 TaxID=3373539 RepID=UPI00399CA4F9